MMTQDPTAFDLLMGELSGVLDAASMQRVHTVMSGWAGELVRIRTAPSARRRDAHELIERLTKSGVSDAVIRDRVMSLGMSRAAAYRAIRRARGGHGGE